jgi:hypothetical protein
MAKPYRPRQSPLAAPTGIGSSSSEPLGGTGTGSNPPAPPGTSSSTPVDQYPNTVQSEFPLEEHVKIKWVPLYLVEDWQSLSIWERVVTIVLGLSGGGVIGGLVSLLTSPAGSPTGTGLVAIFSACLAMTIIFAIILVILLIRSFKKMNQIKTMYKQH